MKFGDHHLNLSGEIPCKPSEASLTTVFRSNFRPEVASNAISCANVGQVGVDEPVKFGDSSSNGS